MQTWTDLGTSTHARLVARRQRRVAALAHLDALLTADPCDRACRCSLGPAIDAAQAEADAAAVEVEQAAASWRDWSAIEHEGREAAPARAWL